MSLNVSKSSFFVPTSKFCQKFPSKNLVSLTPTSYKKNYWQCGCNWSVQINLGPKASKQKDAIFASSLVCQHKAYTTEDFYFLSFPPLFWEPPRRSNLWLTGALIQPPIINIKWISFKGYGRYKFKHKKSDNMLEVSGFQPYKIA